MNLSAGHFTAKWVGSVGVLVDATASLYARPGAGFVRVGGLPSIYNAGLIDIFDDDQPFTCLHLQNRGRVFVGARLVHFQTTDLFGIDQQVGGTLQLYGSTLNGTLLIQDGELLGHGYLSHALIVAPARVSGRLQFDELNLGVKVSSIFELGGESDNLWIRDRVTLAGKPIVKLAPGFVPAAGAKFQIVTAPGGTTGQFNELDLTPIEFGRRITIEGGSGSFLMVRSADSKAVVLRDFLPPAIELATVPLVFLLPEAAGLTGGCFVVPHPAINLPSGDWAGGRVQVDITAGFDAPIDRLQYQRNSGFPQSDGIVFEGLPGSDQSVSFRGTIFGTGLRAWMCSLKLTLDLGDISKVYV